MDLYRINGLNVIKTINNRMPIDTITHDGVKYPSFQTEGNAARFVMPFAKLVCKGLGYDIGYCKKEWMLPGSIGIDSSDGKDLHADKLPMGQVDYIFSSHCLEHVDNWSVTLKYWVSRIKDGGVLFLYLPDYSQTYWRPWNNLKHKHVMDPKQIRDLLISLKCKNIFISGVDLNNSFTVMCEV